MAFSTSLNKSDYSVIGIGAASTAFLLACLIVVTMLFGAGFNDFENLLKYGTIEEYTSKLVANGIGLRALYAIDTLYIIAYSVTLSFWIGAVGKSRSIGSLAFVALGFTAGLDLVENNHIMSMLFAAENGFSPSALQISIETVITQVKFNSGLILTFAISFLIPFSSSLASVLRWLARGIVVVTPVALLNPFTTLLYIAANIGLFIIGAVLFLKNAEA